MVKSNRTIDMQMEQIITDFLMKYCFPNLFDNTTRVTDADMQIQGIDIIAEKDGKSERQDIKAQSSASYINKPTSTFVHELLFTPNSNKYGEHIGWWLDDLLTDTMVYVWIHSAETNQNGMLDRPEDIANAEVMFVNKAALWQYINDCGYTKELLLDRARLMRKVGIWRRIDVIDGQPNDEMHLTYSPDLRERPVNLVIKKRVLKRFATRHITVTQSGVFNVDNDQP